MASVHLEKGGRQAVGGRRHSIEPQGQPARDAGLALRGALQDVLRGAGRVQVALGRLALRHSLLLLLSPRARVFLANRAAPASVLLGQQALPLGLVVCEVA